MCHFNWRKLLSLLLLLLFDTSAFCSFCFFCDFTFNVVHLSKTTQKSWITLLHLDILRVLMIVVLFL